MWVTSRVARAGVAESMHGLRLQRACTGWVEASTRGTRGSASQLDLDEAITTGPDNP